TVHWQRGDQNFLDRRYARGHTISFDSGVQFPGSPAPSIVKPPLSREDAVDPEELFVAALSSCHMLFFLELAAKAGFRIDDYRDDAEGVMTKNADGEFYVSTVTLKPAIIWSGDKKPEPDAIADLHHKAHAKCFIANSAKSEIVIADVPPRFA
ncbi:MAG: OsmC family protein, partial [Beijerinckiaceae bacterium]